MSASVFSPGFARLASLVCQQIYMVTAECNTIFYDNLRKERDAVIAMSADISGFVILFCASRQYRVGRSMQL